MRVLQIPLILTYSRQLWRYRWLSLVLAWAICVIGWSCVALIPAKYDSSARVYLNADQLLMPILRGVGLSDNPLRNLEYLQKTLLSRPNLEQVIHISDLDLASGQRQSAVQHEELLRTLA